MENPLGTTLDLSRVTNLEKVNKPSSVTESIQELSLKDKPDLNIFDATSKQNKTSKSSKKSEVKCSFLSPYLRYKMLKPYLKHVKEQEGEDGGGSKPDQHSEQIKQIREHFDALTAMTPAELAGETEEQKDKEEAEAEEVEMEKDEEEEEMDAGPVRPLRAGVGAGLGIKRKKEPKRNKGGAKKRQKQEEEVGAVNYESADFGQFKKGKNNKGKGKAYDPWKGFDGKGKKGGGGGKKGQKFKSGRSMSYK